MPSVCTPLMIWLHSDRLGGAGFRSVYPAERRCENPARALARMGFLQHIECGIHRSESSLEGSFVLIPHRVAMRKTIRLRSGVSFWPENYPPKLSVLVLAWKMTWNAFPQFIDAYFFSISYIVALTLCFYTLAFYVHILDCMARIMHTIQFYQVLYAYKQISLPWLLFHKII